MCHPELRLGEIPKSCAALPTTPSSSSWSGAPAFLQGSGPRPKDWNRNREGKAGGDDQDGNDAGGREGGDDHGREGDGDGGRDDDGYDWGDGDEKLFLKGWRAPSSIVGGVKEGETSSCTWG